MANPTPAVGDSPVDTKSIPIKWQITLHILSLLVSVLIAVIPNCKGPDEKAHRDVYTKSEVQQMIDTTVLNSRYSQRADIDDLYTWTLYNLQYNNLEALPPPSSFRNDNRNPPQPGYPQRQSQVPVLPPREVPHQKKPP